MAKPDGRIEKGQRLSTAISARAWNRAQDAADIVLGARPGVQAEAAVPIVPPYNTVLSRYTYTGKVWQPGCFGVLGSFVVNKPANTGELWNQTPVFSSPPNTSGDTFAIALEPIPHLGIGRVAIGGVCPARLKLNKFRWRYAIAWLANFDENGQPVENPYNSENAGEWRLQTFPFAGFKVVWHEKTQNDEYPVNDAWALIDLSSWHAQAIVLAKTTTGLPYNQSDPFSGTDDTIDTGLAQLYVSSTSATGIYVRVRNTFGEIGANKWVWLLNPFAVHGIDNLGQYLTSSENQLGFGRISRQMWTVIGVENKPLSLVNFTAVDGITRKAIGGSNVPGTVYVPGGTFG